jgi:predicted nucleic acid-binding protein
VVDASALVEYLLGTEVGVSIGRMLRAEDTELNAPALCDVEVVAAFRRALLGDLVSPSRVAEALTDYLDLPIARHGHQGLLGRVLELRAIFSAYDGTYVALAEQLSARLLTADEPLLRAVETHTRIVTIPWDPRSLAHH